ncbi:TPA: hypothetical protein ACL891_001135 [Streptococcus pneumoniae]
MEHLFKFLLLAPYFYFDNWIEKANRNSKFFPIFYYFYWFYIPFFKEMFRLRQELGKSKGGRH